MKPLTLWHNPRCSKSREALALLQHAGQTPHIIAYLETPPTLAQLCDLLQRSGLNVRDFLRDEADKQAEAGVSAASSDADILAAIAAHPALLQRPILDNGKRVIIARPPERVQELLS